MKFTKTDPMRRDCMNWNSIYMTPKGYPAAAAFTKPQGKADYNAPSTAEQAEAMQLEEARVQEIEQVCFLRLMASLWQSQISHSVYVLCVMCQKEANA